MLVNTGTEEHNGWLDPIGGSRIKTLNMLGALGGLFLVSFFSFIVTLKIKSEGLYFPKKLKC